VTYSTPRYDKYMIVVNDMWMPEAQNSPAGATDSQVSCGVHMYKQAN